MSSMAILLVSPPSCMKSCTVGPRYISAKEEISSTERKMQNASIRYCPLFFSRSLANILFIVIVVTSQLPEYFQQIIHEFPAGSLAGQFRMDGSVPENDDPVAERS